MIFHTISPSIPLIYFTLFASSLFTSISRSRKIFWKCLKYYYRSNDSRHKIGNSLGHVYTLKAQKMRQHKTEWNQNNNFPDDRK